MAGMRKRQNGTGTMDPDTLRRNQTPEVKGDGLTTAQKIQKYRNKS